MTRTDVALVVLLAVTVGSTALRGSALFIDPPSRHAVPPAPDVDSSKVRPVRGTEQLPSHWPRPLFARQTVPVDGDQLDQAKLRVSAPEDQKPRLVGVVIDGEVRVALVTYKDALHRVRENGTIGNWTLVRVEPRSALLRKSGQSELLRIDR